MDKNKIWSEVQEYIKSNITPTAYALWFSAIELAYLDDTSAKLNVPKELNLNVIKAEYSNLIEKAFENILGHKIAVEFNCNDISKMSNDEIVKRIVQVVAIAENVSVDDIYGDAKSIDVSQARAMCIYIAKELTNCDFETIGDMFNKHHSTVIYNIEKIKKAIDDNLEFKNKIKSIINDVQNKTITTDTLKYTFDNFVVKAGNRFAFAAAKRVATDIDSTLPETSLFDNYNPLLIYGEETAGKTHLLNAIRNEIKNNKPNLQIAFVDENNPISQVSTNADVLLVDDVQLYMNDEFFNIYNSFIANKKQVVLTADKPYFEFADGLLADIQPVEI